MWEYHRVGSILTFQPEFLYTINTFAIVLILHREGVKLNPFSFQIPNHQGVQRNATFLTHRFRIPLLRAIRRLRDNGGERIPARRGTSEYRIPTHGRRGTCRQFLTTVPRHPVDVYVALLIDGAGEVLPRKAERKPGCGERPPWPVGPSQTVRRTDRCRGRSPSCCRRRQLHHRRRQLPRPLRPCTANRRLRAPTDLGNPGCTEKT